MWEVIGGVGSPPTPRGNDLKNYRMDEESMVPINVHLTCDLCKASGTLFLFHSGIMPLFFPLLFGLLLL